MYVTCSQKIWDKGNHLIEGLYNHAVIDGKKLLDRKEVEKSVGCLVNLSKKLPALLNYFKYIYLTMESW